MENKIYFKDGGTTGFQFADVPDEEFDLVGDVGILCLVFVSHVVLLLLVAGEV